MTPTVGPLSPRQIQVACGLAQAKPNKIIAFDMGITEGTVVWHVSEIMKRLNMKNRTEVALWASRALFLLFVLALPLFAQAPPHAVTLTWQDTLNPAGTTYSVYRAPGICSGSPVFAKLAAAITDMTYEDTTVTSGNYCYMVTATLNGMESAPSASVPAPVPSFPPTNVTVSAK